MVRFESIDRDLNATPLVGKEEAKFSVQIDNLFGPKDGVVYELLQTYKNQIRGFVEAVKFALGNPTFGGQLAEDMELGFAPVRPAHLKDNGGNSLLGSAVTADGAYFKITYATEWVTLAEGSLNDDVGMIVFGIIDLYDGDTITARTDGIRVQVGQRSLLPLDVSNAILTDNRNDVPAWNFNAIPVLPKEYFKIEVHSPDYDSGTPTTGKIKLLGVAVGRGRFLKANF